jgi:hypothetical protein
MDLSDKVPIYFTLFLVCYLSYVHWSAYLLPTGDPVSTVVALLLSGLMLWSLWAVARADPGYVLNHYKYKLQLEDEEQMSRVMVFIADASQPLLGFKSRLVLEKEEQQADGPRVAKLDKIIRHRYCNKCNYVKPPRAHHCSVCERCVLRMDHHCPFVANCIGHANHKLFWNFLMYASLSALNVVLSLSVLSIPEDEGFS